MRSGETSAARGKSGGFLLQSELKKDWFSSPCLRVRPVRPESGKRNQGQSPPAG